MANTLGGVNLAAIAQQSLSALLPKLPMMRALMAADFSADVATQGESVTTRVATATTAQDFTSTPADQDATTTAKTITLSNYKGTRIGFTDSEWSKSSINLNDVFIQPAVNGIANAIVDSALALVTNANYGGAAFTGAASTFDADEVADLAATLTAANVAADGRYLLVGPTYFANLAKDAAVQAAYAYGSPDVIRENRIPRVHGFSVHEYTDIPANSEHLVGVAGTKQGLLVATRLPAIPANFPGEVEVVTDPESGFSLQFRRWYSADDRKHRMEVGVIYGVAVGVAGNIKRLVSE